MFLQEKRNGLRHGLKLKKIVSYICIHKHTYIKLKHIEQKFHDTYILVAEARYGEILHAEDAWEIDEENTTDDELKPTKSAARLMNLLELVTSIYYNNDVFFSCHMELTL